MEEDCADLLQQASHPVVFTGMIDGWSSKNWTPAYLAQVLKEKKYRCKIAPRKCTDRIWETDCAHIEASLSEFCEWVSRHVKGDNPLCHIPPGDFSCYVDYKYMSQMFEDCSHLLKGVDWSVFGLTDRDGQDSTIWIGSEGASTPCHFDTYGFNLVAQIHGKKRWHLFPPSYSDCLYPTRLPYEESSVFSEVNVAHPDLEKHPRFQCSRAVVVTLHPGQVLYVPQHWWHYVECLDTAVSINTWVELRDDDKSRLSESITRATVSCLMSSEARENLQDWINPNEDIMSMDINWAYLEKCLHPVANKSKQSETSKDLEKDNLNMFSHSFQGSPFISVRAPWDIPVTKHTPLNCQTNKHDRLDCGEERVSHNHYHEPMSTVSGKRRHIHTTVEASEEARMEFIPTKVILLDTESVSSDGLNSLPKVKKSQFDFEADKCNICVLHPSNFATYFKLVHGVEKWDKLSVCDSLDDPLRLGQSSVLSEKEDSAGRTVPTSNNRLDPDTCPSITNAELKDKKGSNDSLIPESRSREGQLMKDATSCVEDAENQACSISIEDAAPTRKVELGDSVSMDLSDVKHMFFKCLLHPRVVKVIAEELVDNFVLLKE